MKDQMVALIDKIESEIGPLEVAVFNIGGNVKFPITETTSRVYRKVWELSMFFRFSHGTGSGEANVTKRARHNPVYRCNRFTKG